MYTVQNSGHQILTAVIFLQMRIKATTIPQERNGLNHTGNVVL